MVILYLCFSVIDLVHTDTSVVEMELANNGVHNMSSHHQNNITYPTHAATIVPPACSPFTALPMSANISSLGSQSTHTSDFQPSSVEDTEHLLQRLEDMPDTLEKALNLNQALQKRLTLNIEKLEESLRKNLRRQVGV